MRKFLNTTAILALFTTIGCAQGFEGSVRSLSTESLQQDLGSESPPDTSTPGTTPGTTTGTTETTFKICSRLDFVGVVWPSDLVTVERKAMALALNITGSFEGNQGWSNLAGNFDGQGMSLGLNQQNLGQGSLQPLLKSIVQKNPTVAKTMFSASNLASMTSMLSSWTAMKTVAVASQDLAAVNEKSDDVEQALEPMTDAQLFPNADGLTEMDEGYFPPMTVQSTQTAAGVTWAKNNLFTSSGAFKTDWKNSFLSLAVTAPYRSLQIQAALTMFMKAEGYFNTFKFKEIRSLIVLYDFVVQNGGFTSSHLSQYKTYVTANPNASETARLQKLLAIRLVSVLAAYKSDVQARKSAIILGKGTVHGAVRDLQKEYCYTSSEVVTTN